MKSNDLVAQQTWQKILEVLDEKMQFGFLEKAKSVIDVRVEGSEFFIIVNSKEAQEFFKAEVNQQRLFIVARPFLSLSRINIILEDL